MASGKINNFPVYTVLEYATSGRAGICPILKPSVRPLVEADINSVPSEKAVRDAIEAIDPYINYANVGDGIGIFKDTSGNNVALYNTILFENGPGMSGYIQNNTLYLSGGETSGTTSGYLVGDISVQGGMHQYSSTIDANTISTSGLTLVRAQEDDVIGKMFLKCDIPFEQNNSEYSIGTADDKEFYTERFNAPSAAGLVSFKYNIAMSGEYDWCSEDKDILIYRYGDEPVSGSLGISIFYDKVRWQSNYGYLFVGDIERFNISNSTVSNRLNNIDNNDLYTVNCSPIAFNYYIYIAGGSNTVGSTTTSIRRYDSKNDTVQTVSKSILTVSRASASTCRSTLRAYFCGGDNGSSTVYNVIDSIDFSSDTTNAVNRISMTARTKTNTVYNSTHAYIAGGYNAASTILTNIEKIQFASDSSYSLIGSLSTGKYSTNRFNTPSEGLFYSGINSSGIYNGVDVLTYSTDTISYTNSVMPLSVSRAGSVQNNIYGYIYGGYNAVNIYSIQQIHLSTKTLSICSVRPLSENLLYYSEYGASV